MPKRFTESAKWIDPWFRSLSPTNKLVFLFLIDNCDLAGFYELDYPAISFMTGLEISAITGAIKGLSRGIEVVDDEGADRTVVWIKNFLRHQSNLPLNPHNNAHKHIIDIIKSRMDLFPHVPVRLGADKGLFSPTGKSKGNVKVDTRARAKKPAPPTIDECLAYAAEISVPELEARKYFDRNTSLGWVTGGAPIKDWRASMRYWKSNIGKFGGARHEAPSQPYKVHTDMGLPYEDAI